MSQAETTQLAAEGEKRGHPVLKTLGVVAVSGAIITTTTVTGAALGFTDRMTGVVQTNVSQGVQSASVSKPVKIDKHCYSEFDTAITNSKAEINKKFQLGKFSVPTTYRASETFNGVVSSQVCTTGKAVIMTYDKATRKLVVDVPKDAITIDVFSNNLNDNSAWTSDEGFAVWLRRTAEGTVKVASNDIDVKGTDDLDTSLRNTAALNAYQTATKACAPVVFDQSSAQTQEGIADQIVQISQVLPGQQIARSDIDVHMPETVDFKNQYDQQWQDNQQAMIDSGMNVTPFDPTKVPCTKADEVQPKKG